MSAEAPALTATWRVGHRTVTLTVPTPQPGAVVHACFEWTPDLPQRLSPHELAQYRAGRDRALARLGVRLAVLEVGC